MSILDTATKSLERIQKFDTAALPRTSELGVKFAFQDVVGPAKRLITLFAKVPTQALSEFADQQLSALESQANQIFNLFEQVLAFDPSITGATTARDSLVNQIVSQYATVFTIIHPLISYAVARTVDFARLESEGRAVVQSITDRTDAAMKDLQAAQNNSKQILEDVRRTAAEQGVTQQAQYFKVEADNHSTLSGIWQGHTTRMAVGVGIFAALSVLLHKIPFLVPTSNYEAIQLATSKILLFGVLTYMLILCAKNFLSHKHNEIINRHRQNALMTFKALVDSASVPDKQDIVLSHASSCIFSPQETGYTKQNPMPVSSTSIIRGFQSAVGGQSGQE